MARSISSEKRSIKFHPLLKLVPPLNTNVSAYGKEKGEKTVGAWEDESICVGFFSALTNKYLQLIVYQFVLIKTVEK